MKILDRVAAFTALGKRVKEGIENDEEFNELIHKAYVLNNWFTQENVHRSLNGIRSWLTEEALTNWVNGYNFSEGKVSQKVGIIMAGNIPLVGFHDFLAVLLSGHKAVVKLSSDDKILLPYLSKLLIEIEPRFEPLISFKESLKNELEAVIATGSDSSAKYFEYYFGKYPHIIRRSRTSVAVLTGKETKEQLASLGHDVFSYFGLGCRNVSKFYVPVGYKFDGFYEAIFEESKHIFDHNKYGNNYNYNRTMFLMQDAKFFDNNYLLINKSNELYSPIGSVNFEEYDSLESVKSQLSNKTDSIQCVVADSSLGIHERQVEFGKTQEPTLTDYADGVDTMEFLKGLE